MVTNCLGETKAPNRVYGDGSIDCPFCFNPIRFSSEEFAQGKCESPWCFAHPNYPQEQALQVKAEIGRAEQEKIARQRNVEFAIERQKREAERRNEEIRLIKQEASIRQACVACALDSIKYGSLKVKYTKHRKKCPLT